MARKKTGAVLAALAFLLAQGRAFAASVEVTVRAVDGRPAESAVVELLPDESVPAAGKPLPMEMEIDQRGLMFMPLVTIVPRGGRVVFANHDNTMHQVYSFSAIKRFEFQIAQGGHSEPVLFDKAGVAAIGCNIHDNMAAFVYVAQSPFVARTDAMGHARLEDVPTGAYHVTVWHPLLAPGQARPTSILAVGDANIALSLSAPLLPGPLPGKKPMHMQSY